MRRRIATLACSATLLALVGAALAGCATPSIDVAGDVAQAPGGGSVAAPVVAAAPEDAIAFTVLGDSNTAGNLGALADGIAGGASWTIAAQQPGIALVGGFAHNGYTMPQLAESAAPVDADYLLVMAGTNDLSRGVPLGETIDALDRAAAIVGADDVLVLAVPPRGDRRAETQRLNARLADAAAERGWRSLDPWSWARAADGGWADASCAADVLHASVGAYGRMGLVVAEHLAELEGATYLGEPSGDAGC